MIYQFNEISENVNPRSKLASKIFEQIYSSIPCLYLSPSGGEAYGVIMASALSVDVVKDLDEALLALWKAMVCFMEEWPYEPWDATDAERISQYFYSEDYDRWLKCGNRSPEDFITWLFSRAQETVQAQQESKHPLNPPFYYPNKASVSSVGLEALDYVNLDALRVILQDEWNKVEGIFQYCNSWFYLSWGTSA